MERCHIAVISHEAEPMRLLMWPRSFTFQSGNHWCNIALPPTRPRSCCRTSCQVRNQIMRAKTEALRRADHEEQKRKRLAAVKARDAAAEMTYGPNTGCIESGPRPASQTHSQVITCLAKVLLHVAAQPKLTLGSPSSQLVELWTQKDPKVVQCSALGCGALYRVNKKDKHPEWGGVPAKW